MNEPMAASSADQHEVVSPSHEVGARRGAADVIADAIFLDHRDCPKESCCQRDSGPDHVEAAKVLDALRRHGYVVQREDGL